MVSRDIEPLTISEDENGTTDSALDDLIRAWLQGRSRHTQRAYSHDVRTFLTWVNKPLTEVVLDDLIAWQGSMDSSIASRNRRAAAVKSLISYATKMGAIPADVAAPFRRTPEKDTLHERILTQEQVRDLIDGETDPRKRAFLRLLYVLGLRISEACALTWRDISRHKTEGTANIFGKRRKTRRVLIPRKLLSELSAIRTDKSSNAPVIPGAHGGPLNVCAANRIVKRAAKRAGLPETVSAHWLRHACASHAMDRGAPPHVVQATLGHASLNTTTRYLHVRSDDGAAKYLPDF